MIVIIADDLGSGDVSCLFRNVVKTPNKVVKNAKQIAIAFNASVAAGHQMVVPKAPMARLGEAILNTNSVF